MGQYQAKTAGRDMAVKVFVTRYTFTEARLGNDEDHVLIVGSAKQTVKRTRYPGGYVIAWPMSVKTISR
ncbi:hypothetical protein CKO39_01345 [Rhodopseudomonas palustris]|nr:hypothetical protein CKO39_01345 [Rhodopseudomonas palustris]